MSLGICPGSLESLLLDNVIGTKISCTGSFLYSCNLSDYNVFLSLNIGSILVNSEDPNEMLYSEASH